ncbi:MAG: hypothetical protein P4L95_14855 [Rouxiella aceris]|jgi:hypothetical protein|uniref:Uncharacterized protein n=1 Tax=Rouxiella aceris TaxID=2703884 RepID=A0A848MFX5_9GAMM|nr:hypothetical protein [Rouxiella aceris]MDR3433163.1 hypothetical protein [Rouxiella aceris]NMP26000.1 hypothetical protein [Rouxiella aceris]
MAAKREEEKVSWEQVMSMANPAAKCTFESDNVGMGFIWEWDAKVYQIFIANNQSDNLTILRKLFNSALIMAKM